MASEWCEQLQIFSVVKLCCSCIQEGWLDEPVSFLTKGIIMDMYTTTASPEALLFPSFSPALLTQDTLATLLFLIPALCFRAIWNVVPQTFRSTLPPLHLNTESPAQSNSVRQNTCYCSFRPHLWLLINKKKKPSTPNHPPKPKPKNKDFPCVVHDLHFASRIHRSPGQDRRALVSSWAWPSAPTDPALN